MNRTFTVYRRLPTNAPAELVFSSVEQSLRTTVGGSIERVANAFHVNNGTNNLNFAFAGDLSAVITLTQPSPGIVDINGAIALKPNQLFWICAIVGAFCLWFLWGINFQYFIIDPRNNYQVAIDRVQVLPPTSTPHTAGPYDAQLV